MNVVAHGIGNVEDLPIPAWMFYWGAAVVLVASFVMLGALWRQPLLAAHERGRAAGDGLSRIVTGPLSCAASRGCLHSAPSITNEATRTTAAPQ